MADLPNSIPIPIRRRTPAERLAYLQRARAELVEAERDTELLDLLIREAREDIPEDHGPNALPHGYVQGECTEECNNRECRRKFTHDRCTEECGR